MQLSWAKPGNPREGGKAGTNRREERGRGRGSRAKPGNQLVFNIMLSNNIHLILADTYIFTLLLSYLCCRVYSFDIVKYLHFMLKNILI